jgi:hypothetical protein
VPEPRRSVLALAVLSMLTEEPMHAYRMQQLIKERRKDDIVNVSQRNSVYQTTGGLCRGSRTTRWPWLGTPRDRHPECDGLRA